MKHKSTKLMITLFSGIFILGAFQNCSKIAVNSIESPSTPSRVGSETASGNSDIDPNTISVPPAAEICDAFNGNDRECKSGKQGLQGRIYYQPPTTNNSDYDIEMGLDSTWSIEDYHNRGVMLDATLFLSRLFLPTQSNFRGFETQNGSFLKRHKEHQPSSNLDAPLKNYFAVFVEGSLKLAEGDQPGYYEFALLSDDQVHLQMTDSDGAHPISLIADSGNHSTSLRCSSQNSRVYLDRSTVKKIRLQYLNASSELALNFLYRRVESPTAPQHDYCGDSEKIQASGSGNTQILRRYYGLPPEDEGNTIKTHEKYLEENADSRYAKLCTQGGWQPFKPEHFAPL